MYDAELITRVMNILLYANGYKQYYLTEPKLAKQISSLLKNMRENSNVVMLTIFLYLKNNNKTIKEIEFIRNKLKGYSVVVPTVDECVKQIKELCGVSMMNTDNELNKVRYSDLLKQEEERTQILLQNEQKKREEREVKEKLQVIDKYLHLKNGNVETVDILKKLRVVK